MNFKESMRRFRTKNLSEQNDLAGTETNKGNITGKGPQPMSITTSDGPDTKQNKPIPLDNTPKSMDKEYEKLLFDHKRVFLEVLAKTRFHRNPQVWREVKNLKPEIDKLYRRVVSHMTLQTVNEYRDKILEIRKKWTPFVRNAMSDNIENDFLRNQIRTKVENMMILASNAFDDSLGDFIKGEVSRFEPEMKKSIQMYRKIASM